MTSLDQQIISFLVTVGLGLIMGAIFDFYYILRCFIKPKRVFIHIGDLFIWLFMILLVFATLVYTNWGEVRFYVFLGMALGISAYYLLFSKLLKNIYRFIFNLVAKMLHIFVAAIIFPFRLLSKLFLYLVGLISIFLMWITKPLRTMLLKSKLTLKLKKVQSTRIKAVNHLKKVNPFKKILK